MNKLSILLVVLLMVTPAWAGLVNVVAEPFLDNDGSGDISAGDVVPIKIVSTVIIGAIDLSMTVTGPGNLAESAGGMQHAADFDPIWFQSDPLIVGNAIAELQGGAFIDITPAPGSTADLIWNLEIAVTGAGAIMVDISAGPGGIYKNDVSDPQYSFLTSADLGDLLIGGGPSRKVTVRVAGQGGTVTMDPEGESFPEGSVINLTAVPDPGYRVKKWRGAESNLLTNDNTVTVGRRNNVVVQFERIPEDDVKKALFTAGRNRDDQADGFVILGNLSATQADLLAADTVTVRLLNAAGTPIFEEAIDTDDDNFQIPNNQLGFNYKGEPGGIKRMNFKLGKGNFVLMGAGLDLSGLSSPVTLEIAFGGFNVSGELDETIINGPRRSIPMDYLKGEIDALVASRAAGRTNPNTGEVTGTVSGNLALDESTVDLSDPTTEVIFTISDFTETLPAAMGSFAVSGRGNRYLYQRPQGAPADAKVTRAQFDFDRNTFSVSVQNALIDLEPEEVDVNISITVGSQNVFDETATLSLD